MQYPMGKTLLERYAKMPPPNQSPRGVNPNKSSAIKFREARGILEQHRQSQIKRAATIKDVVKEVTSGKESDNENVTELRRGIGLCSAIFFLLVGLLVVWLLTLYAKDYGKEDVYQILARWQRSPSNTGPVLPMHAPKVEPGLEQKDAPLDLEEQELERKNKHEHDALASVIDLEQPIQEVMEFLSPPPHSELGTTNTAEAGSAAPEQQPAEFASDNQTYGINSGSDLASASSPASEPEPVSISLSSKVAASKRDASNLQLASIPRMYGNHRHVSLVAPVGCVLRGLGSDVQYDKPLVGAALPRSSLDAELYHLILPSVTMTRGDVDCQFLTKKCLQLAEQEAYLEQLDYQLTLLKDKEEQDEMQEEKESNDLEVHAKHNRAVLKHYHDQWLPLEKTHLPVVLAFEKHTPTEMTRQSPHGRPKDDFLISWGQERGAEVGIDSPSLAAVVSQNLLKAYMADPFERVRDLKHKLRAMQLPFRMATYARKAAQELGQEQLAEELLLRIERLATAVSLMEEALAVVRQNARVALRHLVAQGALSDDQAQGEEEEEDKWTHPVTKEEALEAGVMAEALDWLPPASNITDGEEDLWQPHTQRNIKVKELRKEQTARLYARARLSKVYRELNRTGQLAHVDGMRAGFMGRCAYVADMRSEGLAKYARLITQHDTLVFCSGNDNPRAVDTTCSFLTLPNSRMTLKAADGERSGELDAAAVEHTAALTVRMEDMEFARAKRDARTLHNVLFDDHELEGIIKRDEPQAEWGFNGEATPQFLAVLGVMRSQWCRRLDLFGQPHHVKKPFTVAAFKEQAKDKKGEMGEGEGDKEDEGGKKKKNKGNSFFGRRLMGKSKDDKKNDKKDDDKKDDQKDDKKDDQKQKAVLSEDELSEELPPSLRFVDPPAPVGTVKAQLRQELYMLLIAQHKGKLCIYGG